MQAWGGFHDCDLTGMCPSMIGCNSKGIIFFAFQGRLRCCSCLMRGGTAGERAMTPPRGLGTVHPPAPSEAVQPGSINTPPIATLEHISKDRLPRQMYMSSYILDGTLKMRTAI